MATLREIKGRIRSIQNTQQITKAMKMVASAKMRRAQERMMNARPYADKIKEMVQDLSGSVEETELPLLKTRPIGRVILVAITGDRGLCGAFNSNIAKRTHK
ncbi:F0F1 ATP synthase subunit gamma, partial [Candidatus Saccharibacteria bacterium]|nr:F0F1 ATP synthase subunit gamma [Candidatus Saccharibacteria bacterium]NIW78286.1 F0F1 ATP synthase subunit gamma [Calditrichia bacterium]